MATISRLSTLTKLSGRSLYHRLILNLNVNGTSRFSQDNFGKEICRRYLASRYVNPDSKPKKYRPVQQPTDEVPSDTFVPRSAYGNWDYDAELSALMKRIQENVSKDKMRIALTHRSFDFKHDLISNIDDTDITVNDSSWKTADQVGPYNDRLALLGYNAMQHFVTEYIYVRYPNLRRGHMGDMINFFMNRDGMVNVAHYLGIPDLIRSKIPLYNPVKIRIISDVFCAIVGAIYVDLGPREARNFVQDFTLVQEQGRDFTDIIKIEHPVYMLKSLLKKQQMDQLEVRLLRETGRGTHFPTYVVGSFSGDKLLAEGAGPSIKKAKIAACQEALMGYFHAELKNAPLPSDQDDYLAEKEIELDVTNAALESKTV